MNKSIKIEDGLYVPNILLDVSCNPTYNGEISLLKAIIEKNPEAIVFDVGATQSTFPLYSNTCQFHMFDPEFEPNKEVNYTDNCVINNIALNDSTNTIDDYCSKNKLTRIDFLKIDTDGHDLQVLKGALGMLHTIKYIQIEHDMFSLLKKQNTSEFYDILKEFALYKITYDGLKKVDKIKEDYIYSNYLFTRDENISYEPLVKDVDFFKGMFWEMKSDEVETSFKNKTCPFFDREVNIDIDKFLCNYYYNYLKPLL